MQLNVCSLAAAVGLAAAAGTPAAADLITPTSAMRQVTASDVMGNVSLGYDQRSDSGYGTFMQTAHAQDGALFTVSASQTSHILSDGIDGDLSVMGTSSLGVIDAASFLTVTFTIDQPATYTITAHASLVTLGSYIIFRASGGEIVDQTFHESGIFSQTGAMGPGSYTFTASVSSTAPGSVSASMTTALSLVPVPAPAGAPLVFLPMMGEARRPGRERSRTRPGR